MFSLGQAHHYLESWPRNVEAMLRWVTVRTSLIVWKTAENPVRPMDCWIYQWLGSLGAGLMKLCLICHLLISSLAQIASMILKVRICISLIFDPDVKDCSISLSLSLSWKMETIFYLDHFTHLFFFCFH